MAQTYGKPSHQESLKLLVLTQNKEMDKKPGRASKTFLLSFNWKSPKAGEPPTKTDIQKPQRDGRPKSEILYLYKCPTLDPLYPLVPALAKRNQAEHAKVVQDTLLHRPRCCKKLPIPALPQDNVWWVKHDIRRATCAHPERKDTENSRKRTTGSVSPLPFAPCGIKYCLLLSNLRNCLQPYKL